MFSFILSRVFGDLYHPIQRNATIHFQGREWLPSVWKRVWVLGAYLELCLCLLLHEKGDHLSGVRKDLRSKLVHGNPVLPDPNEKLFILTQPDLWRYTSQTFHLLQRRDKWVLLLCHHKYFNVSLPAYHELVCEPQWNHVEFFKVQ